MVVGLQARPELNGLVGILTEFEEQRSRWKVELENTGGAKLFKTANLEEVKGAPPVGSASPAGYPSSTDESRGVAAPRAAAPPSVSPSKVTPDAARAGAGPMHEDDDDEAFVKGIEQCLKESD